uniref:CBM_48 domain-containing protein n=1 Tax=Angiostrongylus cantonensis TaxID=6313 RepID=A0A0K0D6B5_ANGCA
MARPPQLDNLLKLDSWLYDFQSEICRRYGVFLEFQKRIEECGGIEHFTEGYKNFGLIVQPDNSCGGIEHFTEGYKNFGLIVQPDNSVLCHEWAPGADQLALIGDFNGWNRETHKYTRENFGKWRLIAVTKDGKTTDKLSPWAMYVTRPKETVVYHQQFYNPPDKYQLRHPRPPRPASLRIYEAHVGISSWEGKVNTYRAFADDVIPRIVKQGGWVFFKIFGYCRTRIFPISCSESNVKHKYGYFRVFSGIIIVTI